MRTKFIGFTLVELLIVVILAGILAIFGFTRYQTVVSTTHNAATSSLAAALSAANSVNYILRKRNPTEGITVNNCTDLISTFKEGLPVGYSIAPVVVDTGVNVSCTLSGINDTKAIFVATGIN